MIVPKISHKARFISTQNTFSALFLAGGYDFSVPANTRQSVIPILPNTLYFLDNFSLGGNIAKEDFLSAINTVPLMILSLKGDKQAIYERPIPLTSFYDNKECTAYCKSKQSNDELQISLSGILNQTAALVGVSPVILTVTFSVYAMDDKTYNAEFIDVLKGH